MILADARLAALRGRHALGARRVGELDPLEGSPPDRLAGLLVEPRLPGLRVAHHDLDRHELVQREREQPSLGRQRRLGGHAGLRERRGGDLAERLDVEGSSAADVLDPAPYLRGAVLRVRAAQVDVALLHRPELRAALRAALGHDELALGAVAKLDDRAQHLRDDIARLAEHDRVADQHALDAHDVLVVERRLPHDRARDLHRRHVGVRRRPPRPPDADDDVEQLRVHLLGRVLVGDRPAGRSARHAQLLVQRELVDLHHDAVELVLDRVPPRAEALDVAHHPVDPFEHRDVRARRQAPAGEELVDLALGGNRRVGPGAEAVHVHGERRDALLARLPLEPRLLLELLPQTAGGGVARVRECGEPARRAQGGPLLVEVATARRRPALPLRAILRDRAVAKPSLQGVQSLERIDRDERLAAHLDQLGMALAGEPLGDACDPQRVGRHHLADVPVAAGRGRGQHAALVAQRHREAVDLELGEPCDAAPGVELGLRAPLAQRVDREDVVEAQHALAVLDGRQAVRRAALHRLRRGVLALQLGMLALERVELAHEGVVLGVGHDRGVALVVRRARLLDARSERLSALVRLAEGGLGTDSHHDPIVHGGSDRDAVPQDRCGSRQSGSAAASNPGRHFARHGGGQAGDGH